MLPARTVARLLTDAAEPGGLVALARALGFDGDVLALDDDLAARVGLADADAGAGVESGGAAPHAPALAVVAGPGLLRALLVRADGTAPLREVVERTARRVALHAPHPLWCILAAERVGSGAIVAAVTGDRPPRVAALTVDRARLVDSDVETLRALAAATADGDVARHAAWLELLGRGAVTRRFYRELEATVGLLADSLQSPSRRLARAERRELALLHASRLLFLSFVQTKGWLDDDPAFLAHAVARHARDGRLHQRLLLPLFFGTLNTLPAHRAPAARALGRIPFLNGGLFARTALERRARDTRFGDDALAALFDRVLARYRFTAREDRLTWSDAAVDPEMLGHAFESLMDAGVRRASGAFYTPQRLVAHVTATALVEGLAGDGIPAAVVRAALAGERPPPTSAARLHARARALRILDPACGSGAFLVHALETLAALVARCGDERPAAAVRRELLAGSIFGVDVNPTAVWLCELRLWLSAVIDCSERDPLRVAPLPNLDHNIRVGDALLGGGLAARDAAGVRELRPHPTTALRQRYARASGPAKQALARSLEREERRAALDACDERLGALAAQRRDLLAAARGPDLFGARRGHGAAEAREVDRLRSETRAARTRRRAIAAGAGLPFTFRTHFADAAPGFDLVLGNPPWARPHHLAVRERRELRAAFACLRDPGWAAGAAAGGAGAGFAGQADLAAPFVERGLSLLRTDGVLALLLPAKLWRALAGGGVRRLLAREARVRVVEDWTRSRHCFDAAVYPSVLVARRGAAGPTAAERAPTVRVVEAGRTGRRRWRLDARSIALDGDASAPWLLAPPAVRRAFDLLAAAGTPLAASALGRPLLGVKCGCNAAFLVPPDDPDAVALRPFLRPVLRGAALRAWQAAAPAGASAGTAERDGPRMLWTHDAEGDALDALPPPMLRRLAPWRATLERRADARDAQRWWSLFRVAAARHDRPRVAWADIGRTPRAAVLAAGDDTVPLNSCYVVPCADDVDALALAALLNSPLAAAWLALLAEPARGGYRRFLAWTVGLLPLPTQWHRARAPLAALGARAWGGEPVGDDELNDVARDAFGLSAAAVAPLLAWEAR